MGRFIGIRYSPPALYIVMLHLCSVYTVQCVVHFTEIQKYNTEPPLRYLNVCFRQISSIRWLR